MSGHHNIFEDFARRRLEENLLKETEETHRRMKPGWYVQSSYIGVRIGPLESREVAEQAMRLSPRSRAKQRIDHGTDYPFPHDMKVWEELPKRKKRT